MDIDDKLDLLRSLESREQWDAAESLCISLLKLFPRYTPLLLEAAGMVLLRSSPSVAESLLYRVLAIDPLNTSAYLSLGMARYEQDDPEDAELYFRKVLLIKPLDGEGCRHLGTLLNELGRFDEASKYLAEAYIQNPGSCEVTLSFADSLFGTGEGQKAHTMYRQVLEGNPEHIDARISISAVCETLDRLDEALEHLFRARELAPDNSKVYLNLGVVYQRLLKLDEALACYLKALALRPAYPTARWNICQIHLLQGHYREGFADFDSRFDSVNPVRLRKTVLPLWNGTPAAGKRILVQAEQGYGDTLQFVRYIPLLAEAGMKVILENRLTPLNRLLLSLPGLVGICDGRTGDAESECSIPLLSLPRIFSTSLENIPTHVPYLSPSLEKMAAWRARLAGDSNFKVGICWAGRKKPDPRRSIPPHLLNILNNFENISWYSLQVDETDENLSGKEAGMTDLIDLTGDIHDFEDTAALILSLDLVITIDSAVAHLAGSLAAPTWLLLPFVPDWRWLLRRTGSPWYPTIRIFRQPKPGDWLYVLKDITANLHEILITEALAKVQKSVIPAGFWPESSF